MKIFHLGDLHIGKLVNGFYMNEDQVYVLEQLYEVIQQEKPDVLLVAGDLFDRSIPTVQAVELLNSALEKIIFDLETPVIAIAGNHDSGERVEYLSQFAKRAGLHIVGQLKEEVACITLKDAHGEVNFYPIPYVAPAVVRDFYEEEWVKNHDTAMKCMVSRIVEQLDPAKRNVAIAHGHIGMIRDGEAVVLEESDSEKPLVIGGTEIVSADYFAPFAYTALGHLHGPQKVGSDKVRYAGSLLKYSFSEVNQKKGVTIVELDGEGSVSVRLHQWQPRREVRMLRGKMEDLLTGATLVPQERREDYIRIELEDIGEILDPMAKIRTVYPNVMELVRVGRETTEGIKAQAVANVKEKNKLKLFESFYEDMVGQPCEEEDLIVMKKMIEEAEQEVEV